MKHIKELPLAILGGICITLGGAVYLRIKDMFTGAGIVGALLFTIGLLVICTRGYNLYTGKVSRLLDEKPSYIFTLIIIWIGNFIGTALFAALFNLTSMNIKDTAREICEAKLDNSYLSLFILGIVCNMLIFIAIDGYSKIKDPIGKYVIMFLGVSIFILAGTEHCIADMFFFSVSGVLYEKPVDSILLILTVTAGNSVGGLLLNACEKFNNKIKNTENN
jgi:formate/nitrite transporter FocA (FNT family)